MTTRVVARSESADDRPVPHLRRRGVALRAVVTALVVTTALVAAVSFALATRDAPRLVVTDARTGDQLLVRDVEVGERFQLEHIHSVTGRPVIETFSVLDGATVAIEELWFDQHGANLPTGSERIGETQTTYLEEEDGYRVLHHAHAIGTLPLIVGSPGVDHRVRFEDGEELRLLDVADAGAPIEVSIDGSR